MGLGSVGSRRWLVDDEIHGSTQELRGETRPGLAGVGGQVREPSVADGDAATRGDRSRENRALRFDLPALTRRELQRETLSVAGDDESRSGPERDAREAARGGGNRSQLAEKIVGAEERIARHEEKAAPQPLGDGVDFRQILGAG